MTLRQSESDRRDDGSASDDQRDGILTPMADDTAIIEGNQHGAVVSSDGQSLRVQVGAKVYSADSVEVAVVEITSADGIGIRAGSPGRSIIVPASGIARVSPDGLRVELYVSAEEVRALSGADQSGANHLAAQQPQALAHDGQSEAPAPGAPASGLGGVVGPADDASMGHDAR